MYYNLDAYIYRSTMFRYLSQVYLENRSLTSLHRTSFKLRKKI